MAVRTFFRLRARVQSGGFFVLLGLLLLERLRLIVEYGARYTDYDQATLAYAGRELLALKIREPFHYGQAYGTSLDGWASAPLMLIGLNFQAALSIVATILAIGPFVLFAWKAKQRSQLLACAILAVPLVMSIDYGLATAAVKAFFSGIFLAAVAALLSLRPAQSWASASLIGLLISFGGSANPTSLLITAPAIAALLIRTRFQSRLLMGLSAGMAVGAGSHLLGLRFYKTHPSFVLHAAPELSIHKDLIWTGLSRLGDHFSYMRLQLFPIEWLPVLALCLVAIWVSVTRGISGRIASLLALATCVALLGVPRAHTGFDLIFFPLSRFFFAVPVLICFLLLIPAKDPPKNPGASDSTRGLILLAAIVLLAGSSSISKHASIRSEVVTQVRQAQVSNFFVQPALVEGLVRECRELSDLARQSQASLIVFQDAALAYGCGIELYGSIQTLLPEYERRTWRIYEESRIRRRRFLVKSKSRSFCPIEEASGLRCEEIDRSLSVFLVETEAQPAIQVLERLGLPTRSVR